MKTTLTFLTFLMSAQIFAQLTLGFNFNPTNDGDLCAVAHDDTTIYVYSCFAGTINKYDKTTGTFQSSFLLPTGFGANDVDIEILTTSIQMNGTTVAAGSLLVFDGETGPVEIYALTTTDGTLITTLNTNFGSSHVVGGDYNTDSGSFYVIQDQLAPAATNNMVAEVDPATGTSSFTFQTSADGYAINYGDLVCYNNQLFVVSDTQGDMAVYSTTGQLQQFLTLPTGFSTYRSVSINDTTGEMWVCTSSQVISCEGLNEALSVDELASIAPIAVVPNPVTDAIHLVNLKQATAYQIFDMLGKRVANGTVAPQASIDTNGLQKGMYVMVLNDNQTLKLILH